MNDFEYIVCLVQREKRTYYKSEKTLYTSEVFGSEKMIKFVDSEQKAKKFRDIKKAIEVMNMIYGSFIIINLKTESALNRKNGGAKNECKRIY